jgi:hypothetical protein
MLLSSAVACATLAGWSVATGAAQGDSAASRRAAETQAIAAWNIIALQTTTAGPFSPPREARALAMVSAAVFDAVNSITGEHTAYAVRIVAGSHASVEAAITAAAHGVLSALYPAQARALDSARDSALARVAPGRARDEGVATGQGAASAILAMRANDRATDAQHYEPGSGTGVWIPTAPGFAVAMDPGWGRVVPFFMDSGSQFRPVPPPAVGSDTYLHDYMEILHVGASSSTTRSPAQTEAGRFWITTAAQLWNQLVRQLAVARNLDASTAARAYLLLNLAGADAMIASWEAKFHYNQWRPITAIRNPGSDGGAGRKSDSTWAPLITTPPFPDYPAGHTSYGGAAERVLSAIFGPEPGDLSLTSTTAVGVTHRYRSFQEVADEVSNARVWGGVHWRTSCTAGLALGRKVADLVLARAPRRLT